LIAKQTDALTSTTLRHPFGPQLTGEFRRRLLFRQSLFTTIAFLRGVKAMASQGSGGSRQLYGVILRDKCKTADADTLSAYKTVAEDLLKDLNGPDADDIKGAIKELDHAIASKKK
jgi:hypothetical protein